MKTLKLVFLLSTSFFIVYFSSCINHDYDLNNDKLDSNITVSPDGINLPIGNVEQFLIFKQIGYDDIQVNTDGSLYIEYQGNFDPSQFKIPDYGIDDIDPVYTEDLGVENLPNGNFDFSLLPSISLLTGETLEYEVPNPQFKDENWTIVPNQINFDYFMINIEFVLRGFSNVTGNAKIILSMALSDNFEVEGETPVNGKIIRSIDFDGRNTPYTFSQGIKVKSYKYLDNVVSNLSFDVELGSINNLKGTVNNPTFKLTLVTENNTTAIHSVRGAVTGREPFSGEIDGLDELKNSFGDDAVLQFTNPSLFLNVSTNLDADFRFDLDKIDAHNGQSVSLTGNNGLPFLRPDGTALATTSYYVAPKEDGKPANATWKPLGLNELFASIPEQINYDFSLNVDEPDATIVHNDLVLDGEYKFTLPFSFDNISIAVKIDPISLSENLYDNVLKYVKDKLTIQVDTVNISTEKFDKLALIAKINFLDANQQMIDNSVTKSVTLENGLNIDKFVVDFSSTDLEKMVNAQYLNIEFILQGKGSLTKDDFIDIKGLRIISDGGILYNLDL